MDAQAIITISAAVVALVQILKWSSVVPDKWGPIAVLVVSLFGVALWGYSEGTFVRAQLFNYFSGWISVSLSAAGVFGFTRAAYSAVSNVTPPPASGAGSNPTLK